MHRKQAFGHWVIEVVNANHIIEHGTTMVMTNLYWSMKSESPE